MIKKREILFNPLPYIPILGSSNSTAKQQIKILCQKYGQLGYNYLIE